VFTSEFIHGVVDIERLRRDDFATDIYHRLVRDLIKLMKTGLLSTFAHLAETTLPRRTGDGEER